MRLIDADELFFYMTDSIEQQKAEEARDEAPTVDAVPVIRCKDCENHGTRTNMCDIWHRHTNGEGFCHRAKAVKKSD